MGQTFIDFTGAAGRRGVRRTAAVRLAAVAIWAGIRTFTRKVARACGGGPPAPVAPLAEQIEDLQKHADRSYRRSSRRTGDGRTEIVAF